MKLGILASRHFNNNNLIEEYITSLLTRKEENIVILTLDLKGPHATANWTAKKLRIPTIRIAVHWNEEGARAFYSAADKLIEDCEELTVFFDPNEKSSRKLIEKAFIQYKEILVIEENGTRTEIEASFFEDEVKTMTVIDDDDIPF